MTLLVSQADSVEDTTTQSPARRPRRIAVDGATPTRTGMKFDTRMGFQDWKMLGARLGKHANASLWWLGDWLDFGRDMYGPRYKMGIALTGLDYQTLRNYASVARRWKLSRRRDGLSFQHHAELCALGDEEQDRWMDRALAGHWSRNELRRHLRAELKSRQRAPETLVMRVSIPTELEARWSKAAASADCELLEWVVQTLESEAGRVLDA